MDRKKKIDLIILLVYPIIGAIISHLLNINAFGSVIVFFGLPSVYLTIRGAKFSKRAIIFSLLSSVFMIIIIDYISHLNGQWIIPNSILPRLFQYVTIEVIVWAILNVYFVVMFYEYFLHHHFTKELLFPRMKYFFIACLLLFVLFLFIYNFLPNLFYIPYFYFLFGTVLILIPTSVQLLRYPKFVAKFFETAAYFFYLTFTYEITALQLGWWDFPGHQFIGWVTISNIKFPIEELIFWIFLFAMAILAYYEFFDDREK